MSNIEYNHLRAVLKLLIRIVNVIGCLLESLISMKAAIKWAEGTCTDAVETEEPATAKLRILFTGGSTAVADAICR